MKKPEAKPEAKPAAKAVKPAPDPRTAKPKEQRFDTGRTEGICYTHERTKAQ